MAAALKGIISICIVVIILVSSWFVAVLINYYAGQGKELKFRKTTRSDPVPDDKLENIFWFMQITDLHISKFYEPSRGKDLQYFCDDVVNTVKPAVVMVTGDLTDAKHKDRLGSEQYEEEWKTYFSILTKTGVEHKTKWLDVRGNHDAFDVKSLHSKQNYFREFSSSGRDSSRGSASYQYIHKTSYGEYAFNAIDTCPDPGPKRPFNFFGHITQDRVDEMNQLSDKSKKFNMTFWFGHYPFSVLTSTSLRKVLRYGTVYFCGHLHTLGEVVPAMYAVHQDGHLELELGDWLWHRNFRIAAIDHDLFSFVDVRLNGQWPIILITNPKDAHYLIPAFEPIERINRSTHVRVLVFSPSPIKTVAIDIDGTPLEAAVKHVKGPLYVCQWNPDLYQVGLHTITVKAVDSQGRRSSITQQFSLDGTRPLLDLLPTIILLTDFCTLGRVSFYLAAFFIVLGLWILRQLSPNEPPTGCVRGFINRWFYNLVAMTKRNHLFYPLYMYGVYLVVGPWFVGEIITNQVGCMFVFGIYVNGSFIPGSLTFIYGIIQLLMFNLPLTICLTIYIGLRTNQSKPPPTSGRPSSTPPRSPGTMCCWAFTHLIYIGLIISQVRSSYGIYRSYGLMAFALCPVKTWSIVLAGYLWIRANFY